MLMRITRPLRLAAAAALGASALIFVGPAGTAQARLADAEPVCVDPTGDHASAARGFDRTADHPELAAAEKAEIEARTDQLLAERAVGRFGVAAVGGVIPVYVHEMRGENGEGDVTAEQIAAQIQVLNDAYDGSGFTFEFAGSDEYFDKQWHVDKASNSYRMKTRQGGADALNIWLVDYQLQLLGIATFPWDYAQKGDVDGIRVDYRSLPGGENEDEFANYNEGDTAVHEAGHWLGLFHTYEGFDCAGPGDYVDDTAAQATPTQQCPAVAEDSCPDEEGPDEIQNYMNSSYDRCLTEFTPGQHARMQEQFTTYRS